MKRLVIFICLIVCALPIFFGCGMVKYGVMTPVRSYISEITDQIADISEQITGDIVEEIYNSPYYLDAAELAKLEDLRFDNYRELTIEEYIDAVERLFDVPNYVRIADKYLNGSQITEGVKSKDELAQYFYYVLGPLLSPDESYRSFGNYLTKNAKDNSFKICLEYDAYIEVIDSELVTVGEYEEIMEKVNSKMQSAFNELEPFGSEEDFYKNYSAYNNFMDGKVKDIVNELSNDDVRVYIDFVLYCDEHEEIYYYNYGEDIYKIYDENRKNADIKEDDLRSLLLLMTKDFENIPLSEFNQKLLDWTNEDNARAWRVDEAVLYGELNGFDLSEEELDFIKTTACLSGMENGKKLEYLRSGIETLPYKRVKLETAEPYSCFECMFSYDIIDEATTVGERDFAVINAADEIETYLLSLSASEKRSISEEELAENLEIIASECSNEKIKIYIDSVFLDREEMRIKE